MVSSVLVSQFRLSELPNLQFFTLEIKSCQAGYLAILILVD